MKGINKTLIGFLSVGFLVNTPVIFADESNTIGYFVIKNKTHQDAINLKFSGSPNPATLQRGDDLKVTANPGTYLVYAYSIPHHPICSFTRINGEYILRMQTNAPGSCTMRDNTDLRKKGVTVYVNTIPQ